MHDHGADLSGEAFAATALSGTRRIWQRRCLVFTYQSSGRIALWLRHPADTILLLQVWGTQWQLVELWSGNFGAMLIFQNLCAA